MPLAKTEPAIVVGSGPNGLSAAITLAQAGLAVTADNLVYPLQFTHDTNKGLFIHFN